MGIIPDYREENKYLTFFKEMSCMSCVKFDSNFEFLDILFTRTDPRFSSPPGNSDINNILS
jgi:hypothetical protein